VGVTIIATGFEHKDPFKAAEKPVEQKKPEEKIILRLGGENVEEKKTYTQPSLDLEDKDPFAPSMVEEIATAPAVIQSAQQYYSQPQVPEQQPVVEETSEGTVLRFELQPQITDVVAPAIQQQQTPTEQNTNDHNNSPAAHTGTNFLARPSNIYAPKTADTPLSSPIQNPSVPEPGFPELELKLVMKEEETPGPADVPNHFQTATVTQSTEEPAMQDDVEEQKRRAHERIQKLRNLSFNMSNADTTGDFETVPAYIRRNMELFGNTLTSAENFYSKYTVKPDENDKGQISSINTFLDGKKPD
jgi:cell division protein FtsZ